MNEIISLYILITSEKYQLQAVIAGKMYDEETIILHEEIKAVTYHNLEIKETENSFDVTIVFDI